MTSLLGQSRPFGSFTRRLAVNGLLSCRARNPCLLQPCLRRGILTTTLADPGLLSTVPANLIVGLYESGLPWLVALPLSALAIRSALIYPWFQRTRRINQAKMAMLQPLLDAKVAQASTANALLERTKLHSRQGGLALAKRLTWRFRISRLRRAMEVELEKDFKAPGRRWSSKVIPLLILLAVSEAVRRVCGLSGGLLSLLCGPLIRLFGLPKPETTQSASDADVHVLDETETTTSIIEAPHRGFADRRDDFASSTWIQTSLKTGGFLWCQDLTLPDPTAILPVIFCGTFFASVWFSPGAPRPGSFYPSDTPTASNDKHKPRRTFWQKVFLGFSVISIIPATTMPCALLLYFIGNIAVSRLQTAWLMRRFPIIIPPMACGQKPTLMSRLDGHKEKRLTWTRHKKKGVL